jgi:hypothetical protein
MWIIAAVSLVAAGCGKDESSSADKGPRGLPPSEQVELPEAMPGQVAGGARNPHGGDPHAGMNMGGGDPHAGMNMGGGDPHAGLDMGGGDPHAGVDMGGQMPTFEDVDPNKFLKGKIVAAKGLGKQVEGGDIMFISVKPIDPLTGDVIGNTLAVDRLDVVQLPIEFSLTGANAMVAGTRFEGDVVIQVRVDQDGEARSKQPGDIEGSLKAKIPQDGLTLTLDTVVKTQSSM